MDNPLSRIDPLGLVGNCLTPPKKVVNSNMPHALEIAVERGVYPDRKTASEALKRLSKQIEKEGFPSGSVRDSAHADRVQVPTENNGMAVYQISSNGTVKTKTILI